MAKLPTKNTPDHRAFTAKKLSDIGQKAKKGPKEELIKVTPGQFPLERKNFIIMIASAAAIVIGFLLMLGGSSTEESFNPDIFSTRRVVIGPAIAFLGFVAMGVGIIYLPRRRKMESEISKKESAEDLTTIKSAE